MVSQNPINFFSKKINANFPHPYGIRWCKDNAEKFNSLHKRHRTMQYGAMRHDDAARYGTLRSVNGP